MRSLTRRLLFLMGLLALWRLVCWLRVWPEYVLPRPGDVLLTLADGFLKAGYLPSILASLRRLIVGYGISVFAGVLLGSALSQSRLLRDTIGSLLLGLQTLPSICWLPLALLWFGLNDRAIIFVVIMGSLISISLATSNAILQVPKLLIHAAQTLGAQGTILHWRVTLPAAFPGVLEGAKQGWSFAWRSLMAGELLFVSQGLGQLLNMGRELNDMSQVFSVIFVIIALGWIADRVLFGMLEQRISERWGFDHEKNS